MSCTGTITIEADTDLEALTRKLRYYREQPERDAWDILVLSEREEFPDIDALVSRQFPEVRTLDIDRFASPQVPALILQAARADRIAFIPGELAPLIPPFSQVQENDLYPLVPPIDPYPEWNCQVHEWFCRGWLLHRQSLAWPLEKGHRFGLSLLAIAHANQGRLIHWRAPSPSTPPPPAPATDKPPLTQTSRILTLISHYRCEETLAQAINSMVHQSRPPDAIVVMDDASKNPPTDIVAAFPNVTLLRSRENVGPYRLFTKVIQDTDYDGYVFQDSDDWSAYDRLDLLLREAERTAADLVGTQQLQILDPRDLPDDQRTLAPHGLILPFNAPLDVNHSMFHHPTHCISQGTTVMSRALWQRLNGFATGLRFSNDLEFQRRAVHVSRVVNIPQYAYYRRMRQDSLIHHPETGLKSAARKAVQARIMERYNHNKTAEEPDLTPVTTAPSIDLEHVSGPPIRS